MQQSHASHCVCRECGAAGFIWQHGQLDLQIRQWQLATGVLRPFGEFQAGAGKQITKPGVRPFARVAEAVEIEVPDVELVEFVWLHHGVGGAFHAPLHAQCAQQMPYKCGFSCAERAFEFNKRVANQGLDGKPLGKCLRRGFIGPLHTGHSFYNGSFTMADTPPIAALTAAPTAAATATVSTHFSSAQNRQIDHAHLLSQIRAWALELGFSQIGVTGVDLSSAEGPFADWLAHGFHGDMAYLAAHGNKRTRPAELVPGTVSVITARLDYLPAATPEAWQSLEFARLKRPGEGVVSIYARGRDYHKVIRGRLQKLCERIEAEIGPFGHRVFTDSAPVLEAELAVKSGQGWRGKHTLVLNREAGSMFFLGEIYVDLPLGVTENLAGQPAAQGSCGNCSACIDVCPTQAILAPGLLDARRCISYLTIEHQGSIPMELRPLIGNRIYGCDDCQLICPWNKFAQRSALPDFDERAGLTGQQLVTFFNWSEDDFLRHTEGSPIRRIGHERWLRNVAVAIGNALALGAQPELIAALENRADHTSELVQEHVAWALAQVPQR